VTPSGEEAEEEEAEGSEIEPAMEGDPSDPLPPPPSSADPLAPPSSSSAPSSLLALLFVRLRFATRVLGIPPGTPPVTTIWEESRW
jgi:hypothetical protein